MIHTLQIGGTENGVVKLVTTLRDGFRHTLISMTGDGPLADRLPAGTPVYYLRKRPTRDLRTVARLARLFRDLAPDVVHSRNWAAFDAIPAARVAGIRVVIHGEHGRGIDDPCGLNPRRKWLRRLLSPLVSRFVAVSQDLHDWLITTVGIPARKVLTIHNGVDVSGFSGHHRLESRRALGLPADVAVIGTVGRLDPVKDQRGLLDAFARLGRERSSAVLLLVGDGPCRADLEATARRLNVASRVHFVGERRDVPSALKAMDVYVLSSIAEGTSNTILEAMATGLPVVATRVGGNPELVQDGITGTLVPVGDPDVLAAVLEQYLADSNLQEMHGQAGRRRAEDEFSLARMSAAYRRLYGELTSGLGDRG